MAERSVKIPGPDHPITVEKSPHRIIVKFQGKTLVDTRNALTLQEANYPPVLYIPRADADMTQLTRSDHSTYCPYKGDCSYFSLAGETNAVWTYETPYAAVEPIRDHLAFYPNRVEITEE